MKTTIADAILSAGLPDGVERHKIIDRQSWLDMRAMDVTASAAGALFGIHDYQTKLGLWLLKSGKSDEDEEESPAMQRGRLLEPVAFELLKEMHPEWICERGQHYYRKAADRIGATPDIYVMDPIRGLGNVQVKSVEASVFRKKWKREDMTVEPPLWIVMQSSIEAALIGAKHAYVAPLVVSFGLEMPLIEIPLKTGLLKSVAYRTAEFWESISKDEQPSADFKKDYDVLAKLALSIDDSDDVKDLEPHLERLQELLALEEDHKEKASVAEKTRKEIKAEVLSLLGNFRAGAAGDVFVGAKTVNRKGYTVKDTAYTQVTIKRTGETDGKASKARGTDAGKAGAGKSKGSDGGKQPAAGNDKRPSQF